ncbi:hypothetical protein [Streptomyces sp. PTD5-9]|uniref:hypothetical protein n=1 Tax=Streptomyces sp. PTD5-9 TaxID=3120150 RepID=UPI003008E631
MPHRSRPVARPAAYTTPLLALAVLLSLLLPVGAGQALAATPSPAREPAAPTQPAASAASTEPTAPTTPTTPTAPASAASGDECGVLRLSVFGQAPEDAVSVPPSGTACRTFTVEKAGPHLIVLVGGNHDTYTEVLDSGTPVHCADQLWDIDWCELPRAGSYTLRLTNHIPDPSSPTVAVVPLNTAEGCAPEIGTGWGTAPVEGTAASPATIHCQPFTGKPGERILRDVSTTKHGVAPSWITDESGAHICPWLVDGNNEGCVLPGDGPYRVLYQVKEADGGFPAAYTLSVRRLSDPAGCAHVALNAYGSAPTATVPVNGCKTFTAPAAGRYAAYTVPESYRTPLTVYGRDGRTVCVDGRACDLPAAGEYTVLTEYATLILDGSATTGCRPMEPGTHRGSFAAPGEIDCFSLPFPAHTRLAVLSPLYGKGPEPELSLVDADGVQRCEGGSLADGSCETSGRAPFRVLVSTRDPDKPTGDYTLALHRTDAAGSADCPALPAGDFTATGPGARLRTGDGVFSHCLTIPADDHSAGEVLQARAVSGAPAQFSVVDTEGRRVCSLKSSTVTWTHCALTPGLAHTVLVNDRDFPGEYLLTRRDVTAAAKGCAPNPATAVGGPSTGGPLAAPGELVCRQITTDDARDTLHLDVRDALGTAELDVFGADGALVCSGNQACAVTGSTSYQALVGVRPSKKAAETYRFDALRIATASGPAAECDRPLDISYGYGPVTGALDEQHTAVCAALPTGYADRLDVTVGDTSGAAETAVPSLYATKLKNGCAVRGSTAGSYRCSVNEPYSREVSPSILVLSLPEKASQTAYRLDAPCFAARCGMTKVTVGAVTPAEGTSGTATTVRVTGTALHQDDKVRIALAGRTIESTATEVSADRRTLTAVLDLTGAEAGAWSLAVVTHTGAVYQRGTFTVAPVPLRNTAAPAITGTARVGERLTATTGGWTSAPASYAYQWNADGAPVSGATAAAYTVPASLLGKKVTVTVTARRTGSPDARATSAAVTPAQGAAPRATTAPKITGTAKVGVKLSAAAGSWTPAPTSYAYQWKADGTAIKGATAAAYTVPASLLGKKVTVTVTARRTGHADGAVTTAAVKIATGAAPKATKAPTVSGTAKVGRTLKAARGAWTPAPTSYAYQWYADGKAIKGATKSSLTLKSAQRGKKITVKVTARRTGHANGTATSKATKAVAR